MYMYVRPLPMWLDNGQSKLFTEKVQRSLHDKEDIYKKKGKKTRVDFITFFIVPDQIKPFKKNRNLLKIIVL